MQHLDISKIKRVYMLGIGGIGMSALARYFNTQGIIVTGYDKVVTPLTALLEEEGVRIHHEESVEKIDDKADLVIYSPAIPQKQIELCYYQDKKHPHILRRKEALGLIASHYKAVCIAGTHGKTTISTMVAYLLRETGMGGTAFLGGIASNYNTNFWSNTPSPCVIEADEYDQAFLELHPYIASISSMDPDHLDIYKNPVNLQNSYISFSNQIKKEGILFYHKNIERADELATHLSHRYDYHISDTTAHAHARNIQSISSGYQFDVCIGKLCIPKLTLHIGGKHNLENAVIAIAISHVLGASTSFLREALEKFSGINRRFDIIYQGETRVLINDYAHHPSEINALISGINNLFPSYKKIALFQPHLYSRTRDFAEGFATELDKIDQPLLLDIYPAREKPLSGISSKTITEKMQHRSVQIVSAEVAQKFIEQLPVKQKYLIVLVGAGDIDNLVHPIKKILNQQDGH